MFTTIQNDHQIANFQAILEQRIVDAATKSGTITVGYQGGGKEVTAHYVGGFDFWIALADARNRYWNALGLGNPFEGARTIIVEINPPKEGLNKRVSGAFVKDIAGNIYLAHRGRVGGGRKGIGKKAFFDWYPRKIESTSENGGYGDIIVIGGLDDANIIERLAAFTANVAAFKESVTGSSTGNDMGSNLKNRKATKTSARAQKTALHTKKQRAKHLARFYRILGSLEKRTGGPRRLATCSGQMEWPARGVYFFMEDGELRTDSGSGPRVVRVGTHALKAGAATTLWSRLSQHRGVRKSGGGNHRGSIFRLIVGTTLNSDPDYKIESWGQGSTAPAEIRAAELAMECNVSGIIGQMPFVWIPIEDDPGPDSERGYIERHSIRLLSNFGKAPLDPPSSSWLGYSCDRKRVRLSGLWNSNHVDEPYDPAFLDRFARLVLNIKAST